MFVTEWIRPSQSAEINAFVWKTNSEPPIEPETDGSLIVEESNGVKTRWDDVLYRQYELLVDASNDTTFDNILNIITDEGTFKGRNENENESETISDMMEVIDEMEKIKKIEEILEKTREDEEKERYPPQKPWDSPNKKPQTERWDSWSSWEEKTDEINYQYENDLNKIERPNQNPIILCQTGQHGKSLVCEQYKSNSSKSEESLILNSS